MLPLHQSVPVHTIVAYASAPMLDLQQEPSAVVHVHQLAVVCAASQFEDCVHCQLELKLCTAHVGPHIPDAQLCALADEILHHYCRLMSAFGMVGAEQLELRSCVALFHHLEHRAEAQETSTARHRSDGCSMKGVNNSTSAALDTARTSVVVSPSAAAHGQTPPTGNRAIAHNRAKLARLLLVCIVATYLCWQLNKVVNTQPTKFKSIRAVMKR